MFWTDPPCPLDASLTSGDRTEPPHVEGAPNFRRGHWTSESSSHQQVVDDPGARCTIAFAGCLRISSAIKCRPPAEVAWRIVPRRNGESACPPRMTGRQWIDAQRGDRLPATAARAPRVRTRCASTNGTWSPTARRAPRCRRGSVGADMSSTCATRRDAQEGTLRHSKSRIARRGNVRPYKGGDTRATASLSTIRFSSAFRSRR